MELIKVDLVFLLLSYCCVAFCFPSRPLNERSTELAWEAWLLVDDQNKNGDPNTPPRSRITPKSVFIAPTFSPGSLPECADGYRADRTGTCMQIIKLDEKEHLEFLLQTLNDKFGDLEYEYESFSQEDAPTPGPFQVNIPLGSSSSMEGNPNVAIIVAPSSSDMSLEDDTPLVKRTDQKPSESDEGEDDVVDKVETTTVDDTETTTTDIPTTTEEKEETTTVEEMTEETTLTPTTEEEPTTTEVPQGLFFLQRFAETNDTNKPQSDTKAETEPVQSDAVQSENRPSSSLIRFPEEPANVQRKKAPTVEEIEALIRDLIHTKGTENHPFRHRDPPLTNSHHTNLELDPDIRHKTHSGHPHADRAPGERIFNHRNRDKWGFAPADSGDANRQVQRHASPRHQRHHEGVYRQVPDDLSYLFGLKARPHS